MFPASTPAQSPASALLSTKFLPSKARLDSPKGGYKTYSDSIDVVGWALNSSGIKEVDIKIDGNFVAKARYGDSRPDVNKAYPGYPSGNNSGYYYKLDLHKYSNSMHQLYVYCYGNDGDYS